MPDTPIQFTGSILERFESKVATDAPHLLPIVHAIRDHGVGFLVIPQCATGLHRGIKLLQRPFIVMVGDDTDYTLGPDQYDSKALARGAVKPEGSGTRRFLPGRSVCGDAQRICPPASGGGND